MASAGGDALLVIGYIDDGGKGMIEASLDSGAFDTFVLSDGMIGQSIVDNIGADLEGSFGSMPGAISKGSKKFADLAFANGMDGSAPYVGESMTLLQLLHLQFKQVVQQIGNQSYLILVKYQMLLGLLSIQVN